MENDIKFTGSKCILAPNRIYEIQNNFDIVIPKDLITFFNEHNGEIGLENNMFISKEDEIFILHNFLYIGTNEHPGTFEEDIINLHIELAILSKHLIPFAIDEGGAYYCISTCNNKIYHWLSDLCDDDEACVALVADSLYVFLRGMIKYDRRQFKQRLNCANPTKHISKKNDYT